MSQRRLHSISRQIDFGIGIVWGFFGGMFWFLSWPFAIFFGINLAEEVATSRLLPMSLGIFIGGLPMWFVYGLTFSPVLWKWVLFSLITGVLFFSSAILTLVYFFCRNKLRKNGDLGQPPSDKGTWRRLLLSFKLKRKNDNGQLLQSAIHSIA